MERNVTSPNRTASRKWSALLSIACFSENARSSRDGPLAGSPMSRSAPSCPPWRTRCRAYGAKFPHRGRGPLSAILYGIRSVRGLGWHHLVCYISKGNRNSRCKKKPHPSPKHKQHGGSPRPEGDPCRHLVMAVRDNRHPGGIGLHFSTATFYVVFPIDLVKEQTGTSLGTELTNVGRNRNPRTAKQIRARRRRV